METNLITSEQLQIILGIRESTVKTLIRKKEFPESVIPKTGGAVYFDLTALLDGKNGVIQS